jgi:hypothetical protein
MIERAPFEAKRKRVDIWWAAVAIAAACTAVALASIISVVSWGVWHGVFTLNGAVLR